MRKVCQLLVGLLAGLLIAGGACAQGLLPPGQAQFADSNGAPLAGGKAYFYIPGTTTPKTTWLNSTQTVANTNPVVLDAAGRAIIWGSGDYRQVLMDQFGNLIWDQVTRGFDPSFLQGQTLTNMTLAGTTTITGAATGPTVSCADNSTALATTAFVSCALGTPLISRTTSSKSASYSVAAADAAKMLQLTGATGNQVLTIPALSGLGVSNFSLGVCNNSSRRWTLVSADAGSLSLYPTQCNGVFSDGTALHWLGPQQRYRNQTLFVGPSGSCSDTNDGLVAGSDGQICMFNTAFGRVQSDMDASGGIFQIIPATGTYSENVFYSGYLTGGGDQISINPSGDIIVTNGGSGATFGARDGGILTLNGGTHLFEIGCVGGVGVQATQNGTIDTLSVTVASCNGGNAFSAGDAGHVNISGTTTFVATDAVTLFTSDKSGSLMTLDGTVNFASGTTDSFVMVVDAGGVIAYEGLGVTWLNTGNLIGASKYSATTAGGLVTNGAYASIPGSAGTVTSPGWVQ